MIRKLNSNFFVLTKYLVFIVALNIFNFNIVLSNYDYKNIQIGGVKSLPLYNYLNEIKLFIKEESEPQNDINVSESFLINNSVYTYLCQEIDLIKNLTEIFKKRAMTYNPRIEHDFFAICLYFDQFDSINPWNLRQLRNMTLKFNDYLSSYFERKKDFLPIEDIDLINNLQTFNYLLLKYFLDDEFIKLTFLDKAVDFCIYRPIEFVGKYKKTVCFCLATCGTYFFHPQLESFFKKYFGEKESNGGKENNNIIDFEVPRQEGLTCGKHAAINAAFFSFSDNEKVTKKRSNDSNLFKKISAFVDEIILDGRKNRKVRDTNNLYGNEIENVIFKIFDPKGKYYDFMKKEFGDLHFPSIKNRIHVIRDIESINAGRGITKSFSKGYNDFQCGISQIFIIRSDTKSPDSIGHWYTIKFDKDKDTKTWVADSLGSNRHNNDKYMKNIIKLYDNDDENKILSIVQIGINSEFNSFDCISEQQGISENNFIRWFYHFKNAVIKAKDNNLVDVNKKEFEKRFIEIKKEKKKIRKTNIKKISTNALKKMYSADNFDEYLQKL
ncbi:hypothetical protein KAT08_03890 [Candidatus Babeliales bacterium]|nr:hypothetical protein [Candidatus Babeliales bacterium]